MVNQLESVNCYDLDGSIVEVYMDLSQAFAVHAFTDSLINDYEIMWEKKVNRKKSCMMSVAHPCGMVKYPLAESLKDIVLRVNLAKSEV
jgi:hypothetical protein